MSKTQLKKELSNLTAEQLREIIIDAYTANGSVHDYFEFFINPDVEKLTTRFEKAITRELMRGSGRRSTARITRLNKMLKEFDGFNAGTEARYALRVFMIDSLADVCYNKDVTAPLLKGFGTMLNKFTAFADEHLMFDRSFADIRAIADRYTRSYPGLSNYIIRHATSAEVEK